MNMALCGIDAAIRWNNESSFRRNELQDLKAAFIIANQHFNISGWAGISCAKIGARPSACHQWGITTAK
ncbi:hypothetical protein [Kordiimonas sp.]|uniref:hypothetical protein n=1 Tax=Kordiimonas sp. TaxID=1970157 RepID=UPI003A8CDB8B